MALASWRSIKKHSQLLILIILSIPQVSLRSWSQQQGVVGPNTKPCLSQFGKQMNICGRVIDLLLPKWFGIDCEVFCICRAYHVIEQHQRTICCIMRGGQVLQKTFKMWSRKRAHLFWKGKHLSGPAGELTIRSETESCRKKWSHQTRYFAF